MGMVSRKNRLILDQLVQDSMLYGLNEQEALEYIHKRSGGMKISRSNLYSIKKRISENESNLLEERMAYYGRVGFAVGHFKQIDEIESVNKILFRMLIDESNKPRDKRDLFAISKLAHNIFENEAGLRALNLDTPFVKRLKDRVDKAKEYEKMAEPSKLSQSTGIWLNRELPSSAMTIPPGTIAGKRPDITPEERMANEPVFE